MALQTATIEDITHRVELSEEEFETLDGGTAVIVPIEDVRDEYHISRYPAAIISPTMAKRTEDMNGIVAWFSPRVRRGTTARTKLDNGDTLRVVMPEVKDD